MKKTKKYNQLLLVEDGSVDLETIKKDLKDEPIYIISYRQSSRSPEVISLVQNDDTDGFVSAIGFEIESDRDLETEELE